MQVIQHFWKNVERQIVLHVVNFINTQYDIGHKKKTIKPKQRVPLKHFTMAIHSALGEKKTTFAGVLELNPYIRGGR